MADIAEWSNQHHAGHIFADVQYTIRSPAALFYNGNQYYGMTDIRVMRTQGSPYTLNDLMIVRKYTYYIKELLQSIIRTRLPILITSYTNQWFDDYVNNLYRRSSTT